MRIGHPGERFSSAVVRPEVELRQTIPWLIRLRWLAIAGVSGTVVVSTQVFHLVLHWLPLTLIVAAMVAYNVGCTLLLQRPVRLRHLALFQIILDLLALSALLYYTGGIANPFVSLFVFHVIIASILLPAKQSYAVAGLVCGLFFALTLAGVLGVLPPLMVADTSSFRPSVPGIFPLPLLSLPSAFVLVMFGATYLTAVIAKQLRQQEAQVQHLLDYNQNLIDHLGERICVMGPDYRIHFANQAVRSRLTGDQEQPCHAVLWGEAKPCRQCPMPQVMSTGKSLTLTREDDEGHIYEQAFSPLTAPSGTFEMIEVCWDITEKVALQKELVLSEKLAVAGELAAGLAHDIGNPLDGCQHALELMRRHIPPSVKSQTFLEFMQQGLRRIDMIVRRFLAMARQDGTPKSRVELSEVIDSAFLFLGHRFAERDIAVETRVPADLPPLLADAETLCQALTNILLNAAEAIEGPGQITIIAGCIPAAEPERIEIRITDTGSGIPAQNLDHIFEPFFTTKPDGKGTGLGLAVARRFIRNHGGEITVHSTVGVGSTFVIVLPVEPVDTERNVVHHGG